MAEWLERSMDQKRTFQDKVRVGEWMPWLLLTSRIRLSGKERRCLHHPGDDDTAMQERLHFHNMA